MATSSDPTFRSYAPAQASSYAAYRLSYGAELYAHVLNHHTSTGGALDVLLDVGCGPGNATRDLALAFTHATGVDPGTEMINSARQLGGVTKSGEPVRFEVCAAEKCGEVPGMEAGQVDLLTAAMAAHWFDMPTFWKQAERAVKPGGTVALWTKSSNYAHPDTPHVDEVNKVLLRFERETLAPFEAPGNRISRDMYDNIGMPWASDAATRFPPSGFTKAEWDRDGVLTGEDVFGSDDEKQSLERMEAGLGTASMVTRWREAHPDLVGTDQDCVKQLIDQLRPLVGDKGLRTFGSTAILYFKRAQ